MNCPVDANRVIYIGVASDIHFSQKNVFPGVNNFCISIPELSLPKTTTVKV
jgi:hypothetical protein